MYKSSLSGITYNFEKLDFEKSSDNRVRVYCDVHRSRDTWKQHFVWTPLVEDTICDVEKFVEYIENHENREKSAWWYNGPDKKSALDRENQNRLKQEYRDDQDRLNSD